MILDLSGVRALVTGGTRGIGRAITLGLASSGARVAINYRNNTEAAEELGRELGERHFEHMLLRADLTQERAVGTLMKRIEESWEGLDLLVVNHGVWLRGSFDEMTLNDWRETMATNLNSAFTVASEALKLMRRTQNGLPKRMIFIASTAGQRGEAHYSHYAASKGGLIAMAKSLAVELAPEHITVNCVAPGWVRTDMTAEVLDDVKRRREIEKTIPVGRVGDPDEVAAGVVFLASRQASFITGAVLNINGGGVL